jgi:hypothetical protein
VLALVAWAAWSSNRVGAQPRGRHDARAAAPVCRLRRVALRCLDVGFGGLGDLAVDSYGARPYGRSCVFCVVSIFGRFSL